jgi:RNA polymerase sigma factor (sigma-70 family)
MTQLAYQPDVADAYVAYRAFLVRVAHERFFVPEEEAEAIVQEIFIAYMRTSRTLTDRRAWLIAAVCNASRTYWRKNAKFCGEGPHGSGDEGESVRNAEDATRVAQVLGRMPERDRMIMRLHYMEGYSAGEIAGILRTTPRYAETLLHRCLTKARRLFGEER